MIRQTWYVEHIKVWPGLRLEKDTMGNYLEIKGSTPQTLEGLLRELAGDLTKAANEIRAKRGE